MPGRGPGERPGWAASSRIAPTRNVPVPVDASGPPARRGRYRSSSTHGKNAAPATVGAATAAVSTDPEPARSALPGLVASEQTPARGASGYSQERVGSTGGPDESWVIC